MCSIGSLGHIRVLIVSLVDRFSEVKGYIETYPGSHTSIVFVVGREGLLRGMYTV